MYNMYIIFVNCYYLPTTLTPGGNPTKVMLYCIFHVLGSIYAKATVSEGLDQGSR